VRPDAAEREEVNRIIFDELVYGVVTREAVACHQRVIGRMKDAGCDAVVLGCTEIPLLMNDTNSPLPTLDSTRLLARAALRRAVPGGSERRELGRWAAGETAAEPEFSSRRRLGRTLVGGLSWPDVTPADRPR
jgi:hypothetical protein